jgi:hypothetical protein
MCTLFNTLTLHKPAMNHKTCCLAAPFRSWQSWVTIPDMVELPCRLGVLLTTMDYSSSPLVARRGPCLQVAISTHFARIIQQISVFTECSLEGQWTREWRRKWSAATSQGFTILCVCMKREYRIKGKTQELCCFFYILSRIMYVNSNMVPCFIPAISTRTSAGMVEAYSLELHIVNICYLTQTRGWFLGYTHVRPVFAMSNSKCVHERSDWGVWSSLRTATSTLFCTQPHQSKTVFSPSKL